MPDLRLLAVTALWTLGCERADPPVEAPHLIAPDAPEVEALRSTTTAQDPPPPALSPDLVGVPGRERRWFLALDREQRHVVRQICRMQVQDPCFGLIAERTDEPESPTLLARARSFDMHGDVEQFCFHANGRRNRCNTPLVVAFDGQPIEFTASRARFAFTPGEPVATDWPTAATPWIALDRDGDGAITSGAELFGDSTGDAKNGFEALAAVDDNRDGVIDRRDAAFAALLLWADTNGDRASSPDELRPLSDIVTSIPLAHEVDVRCTRGNCEGERGAAHWRDVSGPRTGAVVDVYLRVR